MNIKKIVSAVSALAISVSVFAGMAVTGYAETFASQDYQASDAAVDWTTSTGGRFTPVLLTEGENVYLSVDQGTRNNNGATLTGTTVQGKVAAGTDFTMEWDMKLSSSTNQSPAEFVLYDAANSAAMLKITATGTWATTWQLNGNSNKVVTLPNSSKGNSSNTIADVTWCHYVLTRSGDTTLLTITDADNNVVFERGAIDTLSTTGGLGKMTFATKRYMANFAIDNVVVRSVETEDLPQVASVNYTVNYVCDGATVKTITDSNYVGEVIIAEEIVYSDAGTKYFTTETTSMTLSEDSENVLNVTVRVANNYTITANATGDVNKEIETFPAVEGENVTVSYPKYVIDGTTLYSTSAQNSNPWWGKTVSNVTEDTAVEFGYVSAVENVVYYSEAEYIDGLTSTNLGNVYIRASNTMGAYVEAETVITTLPAGKYQIVLTPYGNSGTTFNAYAGSVSEETLIGTAATDGNPKENTSEEFVLTEDTDIILGIAGNAGSSPKVLDYVYIVKTGDYVAPIEATLVEDFADETATDADTGASVWSATVNGEGTLNVVVTDLDGNTGAVTGDTTITGNSDVSVIILVNRKAALLDSVVLSVE